MNLVETNGLIINKLIQWKKNLSITQHTQNKYSFVLHKTIYMLNQKFIIEYIEILHSVHNITRQILQAIMNYRQDVK